MQSPKAIAEEIRALNKLAKLIPAHALLGNNHDAINAQIRVIQGKMTEVQLLEEFEGGDPYILSAAWDAFAWLIDDGEPVSHGWFELIPVRDVAHAV